MSWVCFMVSPISFFPSCGCPSGVRWLPGALLRSGKVSLPAARISSHWPPPRVLSAPKADEHPDFPEGRGAFHLADGPKGGRCEPALRGRRVALWQV